MENGKKRENLRVKERFDDENRKKIYKLKEK